MDQFTIRYRNSTKQLVPGDRIIVDGELGTLESVILPGSSESKDFGCEESGGLLVRYDKYGLTLLPLGMFDHEDVCLAAG